VKNEKWKPASPRQMKRIEQLVKLHRVGVNVQGELTGHKATQLINWMVVQLKLGRGERLPPLSDR